MKHAACLFTDIDTRHLEGPFRMVLAPFAGYSAMYDLTWCVPRRFVGDESSVPRLPIAYWIFGGRGNKECWPHDMMFRWPLVTYHQSNMIFHEVAHVRQQNLEDQSAIKKAWRWTERNAMTAAVVGGGWVAYKNFPGCLDYREAKKRKCQGKKEVYCIGCNLYYKYWRECVWPWYRPDIVEYHRSLQ